MAAKVIFCASPGRCGTHYLAKMLQVGGLSAWHEPAPRFSDVGEEAQFDSAVVRTFWPRKLGAVIGDPYIETSHVLINGFADVLLDLDEDVSLIGITRNHRDVALSLWRRRSIPGRSGRGKKFLRHPNAPSLRPLPRSRNGQRWTDYEVCFWHCLEVEARQKALADKCARQGRVFYWLPFDDLFGMITVWCGW